MKKLTYIVLFLVHSALATGQRGPTDTLYFSLHESLVFAMENNLNAKNARLDVDAADQRIWETAAMGLPQVDASVDYNYNINLPTTLIPDFTGNPAEKIEVQFGTKHYATAGIVGNQLVFSGEYIIGLQTARLFKEFTELSKQRTEQEVRQTVIENYYLVLLGVETLELLKENLQNVRKTHEETLQLFKTGFVEEIDADQLEVTLIDLQNSVLSMERQVTATKNLLKYQMGLERTQTVILTDRLADLVSEIDYESTLGSVFNLEDNLDYKILHDQEHLAYMDFKLKRSSYLPTLSAFYSTSFTAQRDAFNFFDNNENWYHSSLVGLSFSLPIFSSGNRRAGVAQKRIAYEQARNNKEFAAEGLQVEFLQYRYDFANALEKYRSDKKNLELSEKVVRVTKTKYGEGLSSSLELSQVNNQYLQALSNYTSSMVELLNAKIKIDKLINKI
jgi:outer membrane protein TolC